MQEDIEASLQRVKERLEKETAAHLEARQKISELEDRTSELEHRATYEQDERKRLETLLSCGSLPDDAKVRSAIQFFVVMIFRCCNIYSL